MLLTDILASNIDRILPIREGRDDFLYKVVFSNRKIFLFISLFLHLSYSLSLTGSTYPEPQQRSCSLALLAILA